MARPGFTYRGARRNLAREQRMIWSEFQKRFNVTAIRAKIKKARKPKKES